MKGRELYLGTQLILLETLVRLPAFMVSQQMQGPQPEKDVVTTGSDPSQWRVQIMPLCKSLRSEVLAEGKGIENGEHKKEMMSTTCGLETSHGRGS